MAHDLGLEAHLLGPNDVPRPDGMGRPHVLQPLRRQAVTGSSGGDAPDLRFTFHGRYGSLRIDVGFWCHGAWLKMP